MKILLRTQPVAVDQISSSNTNETKKKKTFGWNAMKRKILTKQFGLQIDFSSPHIFEFFFKSTRQTYIEDEHINTYADVNLCNMIDWQTFFEEKRS